MASGFVQTNGRVIAGEGDPAGGDALVTNLALFPMNSLYVNNNTGKLWVRNEENLVVGDWIGASGSGGSGIDDVLGEAQDLTAAREIDLNGFSLNVTNSGAPFLTLESATGAEAVLLRALNATGAGNSAVFDGAASDTSAQTTLRAEFNATDIAQIQGTASSGVSSLVHTADTHTFNVGEVGHLEFNASLSFIRHFNSTGDGNQGRLAVAADATTGNFDLKADFNDEAQLAQIVGFANTSTSTITHTADTHTFNANGQTALSLDGTAGGEQSYLRALNGTGSDNYGRFLTVTTNTDAQALFDASFNGGATEGFIQIVADTTSARIEYEADTHTFNGNIINSTLVADDFLNDAAAAGGGIAVGGLYHTSGVVKVRLS